MDADSLTSVVEAAPVRRPSALGVLGAAVAGHLAFVAAPAAAHGAGGGVWFALAGCVGPVALVWGLLRGSAPALLLGVPLGWALPAYGLPVGAFGGAGGPVALAVAGCYAVVALVWLRAARRAAEARGAVAWAAIDGRQVAAARDPLPWVGGVLVAAPALGVALWPPMGRALAVGFPGRTGVVGVTLALLGSLVALAMVTDLSRGRRRRRGDRERVVLWFGVTALLLALWGALS